MENYILVPKQPVEETPGFGNLSTEEKSARIIAEVDDFAIDAAKILEAHGLHERGPEEGDIEKPGFSRLPHIGAVIASFESKDHAAQTARDLDSYWFVPDIMLSLPSPQTGATGNVEIDPGQLRWPKDSGISQAYTGGARGQGVRVGVIDSGCDADHTEHLGSVRVFRFVPLNPRKFRDVRGFDPSGHGTHVCGILAGQQRGIAPEVDLYVAAVMESETTRTTLQRVIDSLDWLTQLFIQPADRHRPALINMSLGFLDSSLSASDLNSVRTALLSAFRRLQTFEILPIVAIGNEGPGMVRAPGYFPEALAVGAVDVNGEPWPLSGGGASPLGGSMKPDIAGYGVAVPSSYERDYHGKSFYRLLDGTSMAASYVTGIAALYASDDPSLKGNRLKAKLLSTAAQLVHRASGWPYPADRVGVGLARFT